MIDGKKYKVVENLGFQDGFKAKIVYVSAEPGKEKIAVKRNGKWIFWTVNDRLGV
jgi:hypothetical protein